MKRPMHKTFIPALVLLGLLLAVVAAPCALAAEGTAPLDDVLVASDGTVTLQSGHAGPEGICSVQLALALEEGAEGSLSFRFDGGLGSRITYATEREGVLYIYVAGAEPLMDSGASQLVLGTVSGASPESVALVEDSLQFVYGRQTLVQPVAVKAGETPSEQGSDSGQDSGDNGPASDDPVTGDDPAADSREALRSELESVSAVYGKDSETGKRYTQASWDALVSAIDRAMALLNDPASSPEDLESALSQLRTAVSGLVSRSHSDLQEALDEAEGYDPSGYTPESYEALQQAAAQAREALTSGDDSRLSEAMEKLRQAIDGLVPQTSADSNGEVIQDGAEGDPGARDASTPAPVAGTSGPRSPSTGDETQIMLWTLMLDLSALLLIALLWRRRAER